jgi:hypothetical protein
MLNLHFQLRETSPNRRELVLPVWFRILFLIIAGALIFGMFNEGRVYAVPFIIALVALLSGLYNEHWVFDRDQEQVESHFGLIFLYRTKRYAFDEIESFRLQQYEKGRVSSRQSEEDKHNRRMMMILTLKLTDGRRLNIETTSGSQVEEFRLRSNQLAEFCGKPLRVGDEVEDEE